MALGLGLGCGWQRRSSVEEGKVDGGIDGVQQLELVCNTFVVCSCRGDLARWLDKLWTSFANVRGMVWF